MWVLELPTSTTLGPLMPRVNSSRLSRCAGADSSALPSFRIEVNVAHSTWVALRILPSLHSVAVIVCLDQRPVRASRRSAQWCLDCIDALWEHHVDRLRPHERDPAARAWEQARQVYRTILAESQFD